MTIDFDQMETTVLPRFKGGQGELRAQMYSDNMARIMRGALAPGSGIGPHKHETNSEMLYVISGRGTHTCDGQATPLEAGVCAYCPKGHTHSLENTGAEPLVFFAAVPNQ